ncbi:MAG: hypothetical protein RLZZ165_1910 [Bacteroidota bacterium]
MWVTLAISTKMDLEGDALGSGIAGNELTLSDAQVGELASKPLVLFLRVVESCSGLLALQAQEGVNLHQPVHPTEIVPVFPTERHPFEPFLPENAKMLILGSFPGKEQTQTIQTERDWYYGSQRNQFWRILSLVYDTPLNDRTDKQSLFAEKGIAVADIFQAVRRKSGSNADENLEVVADNRELLSAFLSRSKIGSILCTSLFVMRHFRRWFPEFQRVECLPSPSPRHARLGIYEKAKVYRSKLLPEAYPLP